jgi:hypothetical protein
MGGVVAPIVKPVAKVVDKAVGTDLSGAKSRAAQQAQASQRAQMGKEEKQAMRASRSEEEFGARVRGSRRRGRMLLSDSRLNPEAGVETLGGGNNLG